MEGTTGKRSVWSTALWFVAMAVPAAAGGYLIYEKQRAIGDVEPPQAVAPAEPPAPTTVAVAPAFADPEVLRRRQEEAERLKREQEEAAKKLAAEKAAAAKTGKSRVITLGPSPEAARERELQYERERLAREYAERAAAQPRGGYPRYAQEEPPGPKVYQHTETYEERQRRRVTEAPLLPFSGSGSGSYESGRYRSTSGASR